MPTRIPKNTKIIMEKRPKRYVCPIESCGKKYSRPCLLRQHVRSHTNEKPFHCPEPGCDKAFLRPSHLRVHMLSHSKVKPYNCSVCGKGFATKQQFQRHQQTHTQNQDDTSTYQCGYYGCPFNAPSKEALNEHVLELHLIHEILDQNPPLQTPPHWDNLQCQDSSCSGYPSFQSSLELLEHYDEYHIYIPESLLKYSFEENINTSSSEYSADGLYTDLE